MGLQDLLFRAHCPGHVDSPKQEPLPEGSGGATLLLEARLPLGFLCKVEVGLPAHFTTSEGVPELTNLNSPSCCCLECWLFPLFYLKRPSCYSSSPGSHVTFSEQRLLPWHLNSFPHHWVDPLSPNSHLMRSHSSLLWFISQVPKSRALNLLPTNCAYAGGQVRGGQ